MNHYHIEDSKSSRTQTEYDQSTSHAIAWRNDLLKIEKYAQQGRCEKIWNVLWPWAKYERAELSYKARQLLSIHVLPPPNMNLINPPGHSGDYLSRYRHAIILAAHSMPQNAGDFQEVLEGRVQSFVGQTVARQEYAACTNNANKNCIDILTNTNVIPRFDEYAKEIDAALAFGSMASCTKIDKH